MNGKNVYGDECSVECAPGYELDAGSSKTLRCMSFGFVNINGNMPKCKRKKHYLVLQSVSFSKVGLTLIKQPFYNIL